MSLKKKTIHPLLKIIAMQVQRSRWLLKLLAHYDFFGKPSIVARLNLKQDLKRTIDGVSYQLDLKDNIQRFIFFNIYDSKDIREVLKHVEKGGIYVDAGANVGFYSLKIACKTQGNCKIFAFEPSSYLCKRFQANCRLNAFSSCITIYPYALSKQEAILAFYEAPFTTSGVGSLMNLNHDSPSSSVKAITIDQLVQREGLSHIDLLKIDVEGHEIEILEGAQETLRQKKIHYLFVEFNSALLKKKQISLPLFLERVQSYGFSLSPFNANLIKKKYSDKELICNFLMKSI